MTTWATVTTLKESVETTLTFVAHHLAIGAHAVYLYFDDPSDPAIDIVSKNKKVYVVRCDEDHWKSLGGKPKKHEARQKANANHAYERSKSDWIIHIDADELVDADASIPRILGDAPTDVIRLVPYEFLYQAPNPRKPTKRFLSIFKAPLPDSNRGKHIANLLFAPFDKCLRHGFISHTDGKFFVRCGVPKMRMSIHGPYVKGVRENGQVVHNIRLLHFHGATFEKWYERFQYRLEIGGYRAIHQKKRVREMGIESTLEHALGKLYREEGEAGLRKFYDVVCTFSKDKRRLRRVGALYKTDLWLEEKREDIFGKPKLLKKFGCDPETGEIEADTVWDGIKMRLVPNNNYTERCIAIGHPDETEEMETMIKLASKKRVLFYDIGANAGVYSLQIAKVAKDTSRVIAFEPNPVMVKRLKRNIRLNKFKNIEVVEKALGEKEGNVRLSAAKGGNLGQVSIAGDSEHGVEVELAILPSEMVDPKDYDLSMLKIDVEGFEASVFKPMFENISKVNWPDYIMMESAWNENWDSDLVSELEKIGYTNHLVTDLNTIFKRAKS